MLTVSYTHLNRPIHEVLLAIGLLGALQFCSAFITLRFKKVREIVDGKPSILIHHGMVDLDEMRRQRYTCLLYTSVPLSLLC